jgi:hypothetical protein
VGGDGGSGVVAVVEEMEVLTVFSGLKTPAERLDLYHLPYIRPSIFQRTFLNLNRPPTQSDPPAFSTD